MHKIIIHNVNYNRRHNETDVDEKLYHVQLQHVEASKDSSEPLRHMTRSKVMSYYNRKNIQLLDEIKPTTANALLR